LDVFVKYVTRATDSIVGEKLQALGGLMIVGPKWCGKTSTAQQFSKSALYLDDSEAGHSNIHIASLNPSLLLEGETPRLIDEWQMAQSLFDAARREIDKRGKSGQFIFTGSATPPSGQTRHSGTGRFSYVRMYPMSLYESGESNGSVSLADMFNGKPDLGTASALTIEHLVFCILRGGWPGTLRLRDKAAMGVAKEYIYSIENNEWIFSADKRIKRHPEKIRALLRSYARNTATSASVETLMKDVLMSGGTLSRGAADGYVRELRNLFVIDDQPAWSVSLRSPTPLRQAPKRHLADPSLAAAAIRASQDKLLKDFHTLGYLFESLCVRDMRIYAAANDASVSHFRDKTGLEVDIIVERADGTWGAMEVKLGSKQEDEAAANLLGLAARVDIAKRREPAFLTIMTGGKYPFKRKDGIFVIPIGCMAP
jgi:predicted AAA+ superfamily ATPase